MRQVAAGLGFRYAPLPNGEFEHSTGIAVLDRDGVHRERFENDDALSEDIIAAVLATEQRRRCR